MGNVWLQFREWPLGKTGSKVELAPSYPGLNLDVFQFAYFPKCQTIIF